MSAIHPGPKLDALKAIAGIVEAYLIGASVHDGAQVLERIAAELKPFERPLQPSDVNEALERMGQLMNQGDYEAAHSEQVKLYERVLGELAEAGEEVARLALGAKNIVTRWE